MPNIAIIQPLLPYYSISFFQCIADIDKSIKLTVFADIETANTLNQFDKKINYNFKIINLENRGVMSLFYYRPELIRQLSNANFDIIIFNANPRDVSQLLAMAYFFFKKEKIYCWGMFHRIGGPTFFSNLYYRLVSFLSKKCLCYTRTGAEKLIQLGTRKDKIKIIGTAIDERIPISHRKKISKSDVDQFKEKNNLKDKKIILQVVRLSKIKKPQFLIDAAKILLEKRNDVEFIIIGDGELKLELENKVKSLGINDSVRFLGAIYDESILSHWYMSADVFVIPTCIGLSAHHAMSYGLPIITDDSLDSQASEFNILYNGINGLTYEEGNITSLAEKIDCIINDDDLSKNISFNAIHTVTNIHSISRKAINFISSV